MQAAQTVQTVATIMVPNPSVVRRAASEDVTHFQGVTTFKPPPEEKVKVQRAQSDVVGLMYDRRQISEARYAAARRFQETWEKAGAPFRSPGDIREFVDGGRGPTDGITDARQKAMRALMGYKALLGQEGLGIVVSVLIDKRTIRDVADRGFMMPGKAATTYYGHLFQNQLSLLAKAMGFG